VFRCRLGITASFGYSELASSSSSSMRGVMKQARKWCLKFQIPHQDEAIESSQLSSVMRVLTDLICGVGIEPRLAWEMDSCGRGGCRWFQEPKGALLVRMRRIIDVWAMLAVLGVWVVNSKLSQLPKWASQLHGKGGRCLELCKWRLCIKVVDAHYGTVAP